jgi:hypothetical protein
MWFFQLLSNVMCNTTYIFFIFIKRLKQLAWERENGGRELKAQKERKEVRYVTTIRRN